MKYRSTRSNETVTAIEALVKGLADDGGLYVPEVLPAPFLHADELKDMTYEELAAFVLSHFLTDIPEEELKKLTHSAYTGTFETEEIVPVKTISQAFSMAEMFHGRTCAFKDLRSPFSPIFWCMRRRRRRTARKSSSLLPLPAIRARQRWKDSGMCRASTSWFSTPPTA